MSREATWARIGTDVSTQTSVDEILEKAGLNYTVKKEPVFLKDGILVPTRVATIKEETREPIGLVSDRYEIYQNSDAFRFLDEIPDIEFVRAGETYNGMVYIIGKLPDVTVLHDTITPYVIFQTSHNGWFSLRATICPLRIVCQNQFNLSFRSMKNTISIQHSKRLEGRIAEAQQLLIDTATYMKGFTNTAEELAMLKLTDTDRSAIIDAFFESTKAISERQQEALLEKKSRFSSCYMAEDNSEFRGTAWGLMNAVTDFETHKERKQTAKPDTAFLNVTFDSNAVQRMLDLIKQKVPV